MIVLLVREINTAILLLYAEEKIKLGITQLRMRALELVLSVLVSKYHLECVPFWPQMKCEIIDRQTSKCLCCIIAVQSKPLLVERFSGFGPEQQELEMQAVSKF